MSASLVGSEMCIRDSIKESPRSAQNRLQQFEAGHRCVKRVSRCRARPGSACLEVPTHIKESPRSAQNRLQ
eukprot:4158021-Alexandrium_andersonii.AAC.1